MKNNTSVVFSAKSWYCILADKDRNDEMLFAANATVATKYR